MLWRERVLYGAALAAVCGSFLVSVKDSIGRAFYYDELCTLDLFVMVPLRDTVAKYVNLNNHFLSSLLNNLYLKAAGISDINVLLDNPAIIRGAQLPLAVLTLAGMYFMCRRLFGPHAAVLATVFLGTSIPFVNYAVQVRGYMLSLLLVVCFVWCVLSHDRHGSRVTFAGIAVFSGLLLYTMPSNVFALLGIGSFYCFSVVMYKCIYSSESKNGERSGADGTGRNGKKRLKRLYGIIAGLVCGGIFAGVLYAPLIGGILNDPQIQGADMFYMYNLTTIFPQFLRGLISWRYCALAAALYGLYRLHGDRRGRSFEARTVMLMVLSLVLPIILVFVHGDHIYDRHLIVLLPFFCILLALGCSHVLPDGDKGMRGAVLALVITLYCVVTMQQGLFCIDCLLYRDIVEGEMSVNMLYNYYLDHYDPEMAVETLEELTKEFPREQVPVVLHFCDKVAMPRYVRKAGFNIYNNEKFLKNIGLSPNWCVISSKPFEFEQYMRSNFPDYAVQRVNKALRFHNLFVVQKMQ